MAKVDMRSFERQMAKATKVGERLPEAAYDYFVKITPKDTGNARRQTRLAGDTIVADYPYSGRLDAGSSKQAPKGMVQPTEVWIQQEVNRRLKGI